MLRLQPVLKFFLIGFATITVLVVAMIIGVSVWLFSGPEGIEMTAYPTVLEDEELQSIKVPTLYLVGEHEKIYSAQKAIQRLYKVAPHIKAEVIPNAGHDLTIVQSEMVNTKVLEFLKQRGAIRLKTPQ